MQHFPLFGKKDVDAAYISNRLRKVFIWGLQYDSIIENGSDEVFQNRYDQRHDGYLRNNSEAWINIEPCHNQTYFEMISTCFPDKGNLINLQQLNESKAKG